MISTKEEGLAFVRSVAAGKARRTRDLIELKRDVEHMMRRFSQRQIEMSKSIRRDAENLHQTLAKGEAQRQKSFAMFASELAAETQERMKATRGRIQEVEHLRMCFQKELAELKAELQMSAHQLRDRLEQGESRRLAEFKRFEERLAAEKKERTGQTRQLRGEAKAMLDAFRAKQHDIKDNLNVMFSSAAAARKEIQRAWSAMAAGFMPEMAVSTPAGSRQSPTERPPAQPAPPPAPAKKPQTLPAKIKAILATGDEGFRFSDIHREIEGVTKSELRELLQELQSKHEISRDENNRYHLV